MPSVARAVPEVHLLDEALFQMRLIGYQEAPPAASKTMALDHTIRVWEVPGPVPNRADVS